MGLRWITFFLVVCVAVMPVRADHLREAAFQAKALIGEESWAQVIRIRNVQPTLRFPANVYALVFELEGRLWFYTASSGTESLSVVAGRLEEDKANLQPLLAQIHPGFRRYETLRVSRSRIAALTSRALPHGCFIESLDQLRRLVASGQRVGEAKLLAFYADENSGRRGHTVLYFESEGRRYYFDPAISRVPREIGADVGNDALSIARAVVGTPGYPLPERAKFLSLENFGRKCARRELMQMAAM